MKRECFATHNTIKSQVPKYEVSSSVSIMMWSKTKLKPVEGIKEVVKMHKMFYH